MRTELIFLFILSAGSSYKFLVYNPLFAHSHATFMGKIVDVLVEAGHDVTVLSPIIEADLVNRTFVKSNARILLTKQDPRIVEVKYWLKKHLYTSLWTVNTDPISQLQNARNYSMTFVHACESLLSNVELIEWLRHEEFDAAISEAYFFCGFGLCHIENVKANEFSALFEYLKIPATIGTISFVQLDTVSRFIGEPLALSYSPSMPSTDGERMGLFGRFKNLMGSFFESFFIEGIYEAEAKAVRETIGAEYTNYRELIARTSFMFTNSHPYLNYPRPLIHKTVEVGGITVDVDNVEELGEKWHEVLNERNHTVFISFGSVGKSKDMPENFKKSLLKLFESMPQVTFIWKYEERTDMASHLPNVFLSPWLPQKALLADARLSLFITHGGLGSTTELAHFGKPAIVIPLFGDQPRNAEMLARHGGAISLPKENLQYPDVLKDAVQTILYDRRFSIAASRLAEILRARPIPPKELVVSHAEMAARFGRLPQLDPYGRHLTFIEYNMIDVWIQIFLFLFIAIVAIAVSLRFLYRIYSRAAMIEISVFYKIVLKRIFHYEKVKKT